MKVTGFTFIRNAVKFDYPVVEAITSILPLCDDFVVAQRKSEDETEKPIKRMDIGMLKKFEGTHPKVMIPRIEKKNLQKLHQDLNHPGKPDPA